MMRLWGAIGLLAGGASAACAQVDGVGTWLWEVTTEDGDAIVESGETATITLFMDMEPDVNYPFGPVLGFATATFDTLAGPDADKGHIVGWEILNGLDNLGDFTTTDGVSLFGSTPGQPRGDALIPDDPIAVLAFQWVPDVLGSYDVSYATSTSAFLVYQGSLSEPQVFEWSVEEANVAFVVVPAPATAVVTLLASFWYSFRRCLR